MVRDPSIARRPWWQKVARVKRESRSEILFSRESEKRMSVAHTPSLGPSHTCVITKTIAYFHLHDNLLLFLTSEP